LHISKLSTAILFVSVFFYVDVSVQFPVLMLAIEVQFITFFGAGFERYV